MFGVNEAKKLQFKPHWIRADSSTCISWFVRGALCRYANSARLTGFYRSKNSLNEERENACVCVLVYECVKKKGVAAIPLGITKIFNLPFMTPN